MRKLLITLLVLIALAAGAFYAFYEGVHIPRQAPETLEAFLADDYELYVPQEGTPPYPTMVGYHGCSGTLEGARDWARLLNQNGFAVVLVESIKPRGLEWREVCSGKKLWGSERAGDIMVSLEAIRTLPFVDASQLHLFGWSHGGWSLMDTFVYAAKKKRPPNLSAFPSKAEDDVLRGVLSATLIYPFCEFPSRALDGWPQAFPVHFVFAQTDSIVSNAACELIIDKQKTAGKPVSATTYQNTDHAFDMRDEDFYDCCLKQQHEATRQVHEDMLQKLRQWTPE